MSDYLIRGLDGYWVKAWPEYGAYWLCAGHESVVGGLFGEWSDCESKTDRKKRTRRMIRRARRGGITS